MSRRYVHTVGGWVRLGGDPRLLLELVERQNAINAKRPGSRHRRPLEPKVEAEYVLRFLCERRHAPLRESALAVNPSLVRPAA